VGSSHYTKATVVLSNATRATCKGLCMRCKLLNLLVTFSTPVLGVR
jgi:hypothetical protein